MRSERAASQGANRRPELLLFSGSSLGLELLEGALKSAAPACRSQDLQRGRCRLMASLSTYHDRRISGSMAPALGAMFAICDASEFYGYCASAVSEGIDVNPNKIRRLCAHDLQQRCGALWPTFRIW